MGCSPGDRECESDEIPAHRVTISRGFWIGRTAVTQEAYQRVVGTNPSKVKSARLPVAFVIWSEAQSYCQAVGMRLPTEAEWEYAARAGSTGARYGDLDAIAWYGENTKHEVGQKQPNAWELYDMLGNMWQWTADWYDARYPSDSQRDPAGAASGKSRSIRGSSSYFDPKDVRASHRSRIDPEFRFEVGLRCVGN
jgi:formylglycine-generating enzyme required for sulfatase activity